MIRSEEGLIKHIREFIEQHVDLIENNQWGKFYTILDDDMADEDLYHNVGRVTDLLMDAGIDPLMHSDRIFNNMFVNSSIKEFVVPEKITELGVSAFFASDLKSIKLHEGITVIPFECFDMCYDLEEIYLPDSIVRIGDNAFLSTTRILCHEGSYAHRWAKSTGHKIRKVPYDVRELHKRHN